MAPDELIRASVYVPLHPAKRPVPVKCDTTYIMLPDIMDLVLERAQMTSYLLAIAYRIDQAVPALRHPL